jgi:hypothetical protein
MVYRPFDKAKLGHDGLGPGILAFHALACKPDAAQAAIRS